MNSYLFWYEIHTVVFAVYRIGTDKSIVYGVFSGVLLTNSSRHANLEGAQECFEIGLGLAFTRCKSGLEEPPARNH